jgi:uncharacterized Zn-binding protein involved in type VI secretion
MPPAARLGDLTVHPGDTIGPVVTGISAKVMIGFMPAACMGDAHVCPLFDGPKPHVGGTILKGSVTVKIGNKPAARVGDPTECKGPPGTIAKGEPTVKIGDMGMGGAGGGGGGSEEGAGAGAVAGAEATDPSAQIGALLAAAAAGMAFCQQCIKYAPPPRPKADSEEGEKTSAKGQPGGSPESRSTTDARTDAEPKTEPETPGAEPGSGQAPAITWVAVEAIDQNGNPLANEPCEVMLPNGEVRKDKLNAQGKLRIDDIEPGSCQVVFPKLQERRRGKRG